MSTQDLAVIENVDLRKVWPNEAFDFTPWLADHIAELGKALGYDLEIMEKEAEVGAFSLDILAHDVGRDKPVIIENQLEQTDHDHLGKLTTYAAGFDASVIVWIAKEIREEHRQALDWLNQRTDENTEFFGVVIELLKIDNSRPAPNFKLVAFPNEWSKVSKTPGKSSSPRSKAYLDFFQGLIDELREEHQFTGARKAQPQSGFFFASGTTYIVYGASFTQARTARVELYLDKSKEENKRLFDALSLQRETIEKELQAQEEVSWERLDNNQASRIAVYRPGTIDDEPVTKAEIHSWMVQHLLRFKSVFGPRIKTVLS